MKLVIDEICIKNFLSYGNKPQTFKPEVGLNLIIGYNRENDKSNAAGKTSLLESIPFALFGKILKEVPQEDIINWKNKKNCEVQLKFTLGGSSYIVNRCLAPNALEIYQNSKLVKSFSDKKDYQHWLEEDLLHSEFLTFKNLFSLNLRTSGSILEMKKWDKRKFLNKLFTNLQLYTKIYERCNFKLKSLEGKLVNIHNEIHNKESLIKHHQVEVDKLRLKLSKTLSYDDELNELKLSINKLDDKLSLTNDQLPTLTYDELETIITNHKLTRGKLKSLKDELLQDVRQLDIKVACLNALIDDTDQRFEQMGGSETCPLCWSKIDPVKIRQAMDKDNIVRVDELTKLTAIKTDLMTKLAELDLAIQVEDTGIQDKRNQQTDINRISSELTTLKLNKTQLESNLTTIMDKIKLEESLKLELNEDINRHEHQIIDLRGEILELNKKIKNLQTIFDYLDYIKNICTDDGVRQYAISSIVPYVNAQINSYLSDLEFDFFITLDRWFEPTIKAPGCATGKYKSLSAGEQKSLDLACQQALLDVVRIQATVFPDIILYDELLDSSMDGSSIDQLVKIIRRRQLEDESKMYVISHRKEISEIEFDNTYLVEKNNGFSTFKKL